MRNYKDILQSTWFNFSYTLWNNLKEEMEKIQYYKGNIRLVNTFLLIHG